jgi:outer membrane protein assembly factor BamB
MEKLLKIAKYGIFIFVFSLFSCNDEDTIIDTKPVGAFSYSIQLSNNNTEVVTTFTDLSFDQNGNIVSWLWNFGDGTTSTERSPIHTYPLGNFSASLTVTDNNGNVNVNTFSQVLDFTVIVEPTRLWAFNLPGKIEYSSPAVSDENTVFIGITEAVRTNNGPNFFAVKNGTKVWETLLPNVASSDQIQSSASIASDGSIYMSSLFERFIYKINSGNGTIESRFKTNSRMRYSAPTFALDGSVIIANYNNNDRGVRSLSTDLSTQNWIFKTGVDFNATATIGADGTIYIGAINGFLYAINPDGTEKWSSNFGTWTATTPAIGPDGTIYFAGEGNKQDPTFKGILTAYNPANGNIKWSVGLTEKVNHGGPAVAADGTIYLGGYEKRMVAYNPTDGSEKWSYPVSSAIEVVPAIDNDGNIYFGDTGGSFHVVSPIGQKKWKVAKLGDQINTSAAIGKDGVIYVGANTAGVGKLFALKTNATGLQTGGWSMFAKNAKHQGR